MAALMQDLSIDFLALGNFGLLIYLHGESQSAKGRKGPPEIEYNPTCKVGPPRAGHAGMCPGGFCKSLEEEAPQRLWAACSRAHSKGFSHVEMEFLVVEFTSTAPHPVTWVSLKRDWFHLPDSYSSDVCRHW